MEPPSTPATAIPVGERAVWASWVILGMGVVAASVSAILIRYATDADPLAISFWRCAAGALALAPLARFRGAIAPAEFRASAIAGVFLALHFATWITSLGYTSVAASVLLVSATPVFVAIAARFLFKERLAILGWLGIGVALVGTALVSGAGGSGSDSTLGNLLALAGGAAAAGYLLGGRAARRRLGIIEYAVIAYAVAGVVLFAVVVLQAIPLNGYGSRTWWAIAGLVVGPQLLGHTLINFVLDDLDPTTVSMTIMAEPLIAIAMAYALFSETPSRLVYPGGIAILFGIYLVSSVRKTPVVIVE